MIQPFLFAIIIIPGSFLEGNKIPLYKVSQSVGHHSLTYSSSFPSILPSGFQCNPLTLPLPIIHVLTASIVYIFDGTEFLSEKEGSDLYPSESEREGMERRESGGGQRRYTLLMIIMMVVVNRTVLLVLVNQKGRRRLINVRARNWILITKLNTSLLNVINKAAFNLHLLLHIINYALSFSSLEKMNQDEHDDQHDSFQSPMSRPSRRKEELCLQQNDSLTPLFLFTTRDFQEQQVCLCNTFKNVPSPPS